MVETLEQFREEVEAEFPLDVNDLFIEDKIDKILNRALSKVFKKTEIIKNKVISSSTVIDDAESIVKVTSTFNNKAYRNVFYYMMDERVRPTSNFEWYYTSDGKVLVELYANISNVYVEYVKKRSMLDVSDLPEHRLDFAIRYAVAMMKYQEGVRGTQAKLTDSPFEYNYEQLMEQGKEEMENLEEELEESYFGLFGGKSH